jgi:hypothetical protein
MAVGSITAPYAARPRAVRRIATAVTALGADSKEVALWSSARGIETMPRRYFLLPPPEP